MKTVITLAACIAMSTTFFTPTAKADEWDRKTVVSFSEPVEVPGVVLPAGKYVFRLADSESDRHIVQVLNTSEDKVFATLLAIPSEQLTTPDKTIITFEERAAGAPEAVKTWFYPGDNIGEEFVYPKPRAMELAKANHQPVKAMPAEFTQNITKSTTPTSAPASEPHVAKLKSAPVQVAQPKGDSVEVVEIAQMTKADRLPETASTLPLIMLAGIGALAAAGAVRMARSY